MNGSSTFNNSICLFLFLLFFQIGCKNPTECHFKKKDSYCTVRILILENETLKTILDSVIKFEERKPFYDESSHFIISLDSFYPNNFFIEALHNYDKTRHLHSSDTLYVFAYENHLFVLADNSLIKTGFFSIPKLTVKFSTIRSNEIYSIDDRGTIWKICMDKENMQVIDFSKVN